MHCTQLYGNNKMVEYRAFIYFVPVDLTSINMPNMPNM